MIRHLLVNLSRSYMEHQSLKVLNIYLISYKMDTQIEHVIFMTPENRSFNHVFGYLENINSDEKGIAAVSGSDGLFFDIAYGQSIINEALRSNPDTPEEQIRLSKQSFINAQKKGICDTNSFAKNKIEIS